MPVIGRRGADQFVYEGGHAVPRVQRRTCDFCDGWMTVDILEPKHKCPHCGWVRVSRRDTSGDLPK